MEQAGSYPDPTKASPPYAQFSTSLLSTSPAMTGDMASLIKSFRKRRTSFTERSAPTPGGAAHSYAGSYSTVGTAGGQGISVDGKGLVSCCTVALCWISIRVLCSLQVGIASVSLPKSPFALTLGDAKAGPTSSAENTSREQQRHQAWNEGGNELESFSRMRLGSASSAAGGDDYYDADSGRQFRISDAEETESGKSNGRWDDHGRGGIAGLLMRDDEDDDDNNDEDEDDDRGGGMFAFVLNPQEVPASPSDRGHQLLRRHSRTGSSVAQTRGQFDEGLLGAAALTAELRGRMSDLKTFSVNLAAQLRDAIGSAPAAAAVVRVQQV